MQTSPGTRIRRPAIALALLGIAFTAALFIMAPWRGSQRDPPAAGVPHDRPSAATDPPFEGRLEPTDNAYPGDASGSASQNVGRTAPDDQEQRTALADARERVAAGNRILREFADLWAQQPDTAWDVALESATQVPANQEETFRRWVATRALPALSGADPERQQIAYDLLSAALSDPSKDSRERLQALSGLVGFRSFDGGLNIGTYSVLHLCPQDPSQAGSATYVLTSAHFRERFIEDPSIQAVVLRAAAGGDDPALTRSAMAALAVFPDSQEVLGVLLPYLADSADADLRMTATRVLTLGFRLGPLVAMDETPLRTYLTDNYPTMSQETRDSIATYVAQLRARQPR